METGEEKTMGEIAAIFSGGISEKAVQRDLFYLVKSGKLVAKGDKRWRKYGLAPLLLHDKDFLKTERPIPLNAPKETPQNPNFIPPEAGLTERNI